MRIITFNFNRNFISKNSYHHLICSSITNKSTSNPSLMTTKTHRKILLSTINCITSIRNNRQLTTISIPMLHRVITSTHPLPSLIVISLLITTNSPLQLKMPECLFNKGNKPSYNSSKSNLMDYK